MYLYCIKKCHVLFAVLPLFEIPGDPASPLAFLLTDQTRTWKLIHQIMVGLLLRILLESTSCLYFSGLTSADITNCTTLQWEDQCAAVSLKKLCQTVAGATSFKEIKRKIVLWMGLYSHCKQKHR